MALDFRKATDELLSACISHQELADALGVSVPSVRQARLDSDAKAHRSAPEGWEKAVRKLAEDRAARLGRLAGRLKT
jgi:hypothetical protein